jgi:hypothetical protein
VAPFSACARRRRRSSRPRFYRSFGTFRRQVTQVSTQSPGGSTRGRSLQLTVGNGGMCRCGRCWIGPPKGREARADTEMRDRYAADVSDFLKFAFLRTLTGVDRKLSVAW